MAQKLTGAPSSDDVASGLETTENAIVSRPPGGAAASARPLRSRSRAKHKLQRRKSWVKRKTKRCEVPTAGGVSLVNGVLSLALYFLDVFTDVQLWRDARSTT